MSDIFRDMKTTTKTLLGITAFFGTIASWHTVMPTSLGWLTLDQFITCLIIFFLSSCALALSSIEL